MSTAMSHGTVIIGAGQAGHTAAMQLRAAGYEAPVTVIGDEPAAPYQRPPLSKRYLLREVQPEHLALGGRARGPQIDLRTGERVARIDVDRRVVVSDAGTSYRYDHLVLATGTRARRLPESLVGGLAGVHVLRTLADADTLAGALDDAKSVLVLGGGFIGLEFAAVAARLGRRVTVVERNRVLGRVVSEKAAEHIRSVHLGNGVEFVEGRELASFDGVDGRVTAGVMTDGTRIEADLVLVGIGAEPVAELAADAGLEVDNGITVDELGRTSAPGVYAIGDCANFAWCGGRRRLESVQNAEFMAKAAAAHIAGRETPPRPAPWFWSDQYDVKLQIVGLLDESDTVVTRKSEDGNGFSLWHYRGDDLVAVEALNDPGAFLTARRLMDRGVSPAQHTVADESLGIRDIAAQALEATS
ncbi:FAD-dependent oxidoreductase [Rhodococcus sp. HM1]|uniref:NAD(P)/FAD-dependent oxidoreductase n=1 Tax=unclassified Rhodococcus (in: high G+C Gram-positive bacteria) TaxID=192944 RepID=UPI0018CFAF35|nr:MULTISPECIES: FAD-dependent oxidoreductase [unclassified Rhodococcus (in: high G+C Gram-positive bacteria)]MBH0122195.1 FAD-dependent oxidoreductase [Rhodococcus sp. CX]MCK8669951.1 FAD-dependent oxidoreductase [Rhodococcus sp. HM1]